MSALAALPGAPTAERLAHGRFAQSPAIGTEAEQARAGLTMFRAVPTLERLRRDGSISVRQADAGTRLRDDFELGICGARDGAGGNGAAVGWYFTLSQLAAVNRWQQAIAALGPRLAAVVRPIVVGLPGGGDVSIVDLARRLGTNRQELSGVLKLGLDVLADHYGLP